MPEGDPHDPHHEESFEEFTARFVRRIHPPQERADRPIGRVKGFSITLTRHATDRDVRV